jgi:hypothetical protein
MMEKKRKGEKKGKKRGDRGKEDETMKERKKN